MNRYAEILDTLAAEGRLRTIPADGFSGLDLSQNDYLGLAMSDDIMDGDSLCTEAFTTFPEAFTPSAEAFTSSASRLLASRQGAYSALEAELQRLYGRPALLFNSGYHANTGIIQALAVEGTLIVSDRLVHASAIDGIRLSKAPFTRFAHNSLPALERVLEKNHDQYERLLVIVESIYSMDGDVAPLAGIVALKRRFPKMLLYVDEAHGVGCRGERGLGVCEELGILPDVDVLVGTFGKALASAGAFAVTSPLLKSYLINTARSFIFSTALPPVNQMWSLAMLRKMTSMKCERDHLLKISRRLSEGLQRITGQPTGSQSQIVPWIIGDAERAVRLSKMLEARGFHSLPIRRPTVPPGTERIRFSLNARISEEQVDALLRAIGEIAGA